MTITSRPEPSPTEAEFSSQMDVIFDGMRAGHAQEHDPVEEPSSPVESTTGRAREPGLSTSCPG
ncbi:Uncharacterised protein [Acidipropionibacterium jensenii]|uniref:Uncharacterized protein n=1 Tax=Acidipropionibacterium jensenii TaxID=1749 RepID=A0A3S4UR22_9ACTN|nr:Uncharacterised protein [Acidipropionibacterium jensenii]